MVQRNCCFAHDMVTLRPVDAADFQQVVEDAEDMIVRLMPGQYIVEVDCKNNPIDVPDNCTILAYGAEVIFRFTNAGGYWGDEVFDIADVLFRVFGGKWWIDRANSAEADARRLFHLSYGATAIFKNIEADNGSGREAILTTDEDSEVRCYDCYFRPLQNTYTSNLYIAAFAGGSLIVNGCKFEGFYPGQTTVRTNVGVYVSPKGIYTCKIGNSLFRHLAAGIGVEHGNNGEDAYGVHIHDCDFLDMSGSHAYWGMVYFRTENAAAAGYNLYDSIIEGCSFRGGSSGTGQIGTPRSSSGQTGIKRLVIRDCTMVPDGEYSTAKYAIDFREPGSGGTAVSIAELSDISIADGYGTAQLNIDKDIPVGRHSLTLET